MAILPELVAPITVDLRAIDETFNIIKGMENLNYTDFKMDDPTLTINPGLWVKITTTGCTLPGAAGLPNVYPVVVGNNEYDSIATKQVSVVVNGGWRYKTTQFVAASYSIGDLLAVAATGQLQAAGSGYAVAKVDAYDSVKNILTVKVL